MKKLRKIYVSLVQTIENKPLDLEALVEKCAKEADSCPDSTRCKDSSGDKCSECIARRILRVVEKEARR
jgi:hypothetical protein